MQIYTIVLEAIIVRIIANSKNDRRLTMAGIVSLLSVVGCCLNINSAQDDILCGRILNSLNGFSAVSLSSKVDFSSISVSGDVYKVDLSDGSNFQYNDSDSSIDCFNLSAEDDASIDDSSLQTLGSAVSTQYSANTHLSIYHDYFEKLTSFPRLSVTPSFLTQNENKLVSSFGALLSCYSLYCGSMALQLYFDGYSNPYTAFSIGKADCVDSGVYITKSPYLPTICDDIFGVLGNARFDDFDSLFDLFSKNKGLLSSAINTLMGRFAIESTETIDNVGRMYDFAFSNGSTAYYPEDEYFNETDYDDYLDNMM